MLFVRGDVVTRRLFFRLAARSLRHGLPRSPAGWGRRGRKRGELRALLGRVPGRVRCARGVPRGPSLAEREAERVIVDGRIVVDGRMQTQDAAAMLAEARAGAARIAARAGLEAASAAGQEASCSLS